MKICIFSSQKRLVFHHAGPEHPHAGHEKRERREEPEKSKAGVPINVEEAKKGPAEATEAAEAVLESGDLFKTRGEKNQTYVNEHPDNRAQWRFLSFRHQMEYRQLGNESQRERYLKQHSAEIQSAYLRDKAAWERMPALARVPKLRPSLIDRPELMVDKPVYALGGTVSRGIAEKFRGGKAEYIPGGDPVTVLRNFEEQVAGRVSSENLKGASAVVTFDADLFGSQTAHKEYVEGTRKLLSRLKELGMVVTVLSPLKTWNFGFQNVPADVKGFVPAGYSRDQIMARQRRNEFWNELGRFKEAGLVDSLVDLADSLQARDTMGTNMAFLTEEGGRKVLNDKGIEMAVNGAIMGINAAHGYDGGRFSNERYWQGGEDYELGKTTIKGKPVERAVAGAALLPESVRKEALEKVKPKDILDPLRRVTQDLMGPELFQLSHTELYEKYMDKNKRFIPGMYVYSWPAKRVVHEAFLALQAEKNAGKDVSALTQEFTRLASRAYVQLARIAIIHARELFEDPNPLYLQHRKAAFDHVKWWVKNAEDANSYYHFYDSNISGLRKEFDDFKALEPVKAWPGSRT